MEIEKRFKEEDWEEKPDIEGVRERLIIGDDICKSSNVRMVRLSPDFESVPHEHPQLQVFYILKGTGTLTIEQRTLHIMEGSRVIVKPNQLHSIKNDGKEELEIIIFDEFDKCFETFSPYVDF
ncbi:MAG: cupin domain-containing protein [Methanobacteriota archaeon]|nr:MAG: cupin domain-containing protein [Euryarchaeota archaeon]